MCLLFICKVERTLDLFKFFKNNLMLLKAGCLKYISEILKKVYLSFSAQKVFLNQFKNLRIYCFEAKKI